MNAGRGDGLVRVLVWTVLYAIPAVVALQGSLDYDIWWHLRTGQWIVSHGTVPWSDPFSQYGLDSGKTWIAYSWLYEVVVWKAFALAGPLGLALLRLALTLLLVSALHYLVAKRTRHFLTATALLGLAVLALLPLIADRPWLFTILLSTVLLDVVLDAREGKAAWRLWLLPALFALWANLHIQFVHGLLILGLACLAVAVEKRRLPWKWFAVTALCTAATLSTPYHVHVWGVIAEYGSHRVPTAHIAEFQSLEFRHFWDWCVLALAGWAAFALGRRSRLPTFEGLLLIAAAWFAFQNRRDLWLLILAALVAVPGEELVPAGERVVWPTWRLGLIAAVLVGAVLIGFAFVAAPGARLSERITRQYPVQAVEFVRSQGLDGPLYNSLDWGGYLIWALPEMPVAMDGRTNLHTDNRIARHLRTWLGQSGWADDPDLTAAHVVIAERGVPLTSLLRLYDRFRVAYEDEVAVVFVRR